MPENVVRTKPTEVDWARLAAFIDGEGCISIVKQNRPMRPDRPHVYMLELHIGNNDPRLAYWCKSTFGVGFTFTRKAPKNSPRPFYCWLVHGVKAAKLLEGCYSYFTLKREQAEVAFAFAALACKSGRGTVSDSNYQQRGELKRKLSEIKLVQAEPPEDWSNYAGKTRA